MSRLDYMLFGDAPLVIIVSGTTDHEIFAAYAESGVFPDYFDANFDSLEACLRDLINIEEQNLILLHREALDRGDARVAIYLDILADLADHPRLIQVLREPQRASLRVSG